MFQVLFVACAICAVDQLSKFVVLRRFGDGRSARVGPWVGVRLVLNRREGLLPLRRRRDLLVVWAPVLLAAVLLLQIAGAFAHEGARAGLGMAIGGSAGNVLDRLWRGAVVDFIDLGWWPVFNLADAAIVLGTALLLWFLLYGVTP